MDSQLGQDYQNKILKLFSKNQTVNEIARSTGLPAKEVLLFLTEKGLWSEFCSGCQLKRCYDCHGLQEFGAPISVQDQIDFIAELKRLQNGKG